MSAQGALAVPTGPAAAAGWPAVDAEVALGVERSATGRRWLTRPVDPTAVAAMAQCLGMPEIVCRLLVARGIGVGDADAYLTPTLRTLLPDPSLFRDMDAAAARLVRAIADAEAVAVFADYDVDGATSAALLVRFFAALGRPLRVYVPDRITEGYGPSADALLRLRAEGVSVVVTVDCGTTAHDALAAAAGAGLEVIVVDHHKTDGTLPPATALINPNRGDDASDQGHLAAVGVTFMLVVAVNRALRTAGFYVGPGRPEPDLRRWLDLVALGTLCDMVPLVGVNRALVVQGLKVMAQWSNPGLKALAQVAGVEATPGAYHVGFVLGPRINAGGRVGDAGLGARLLACDETGEAADLADRLDRANRARREIEAAVHDQAMLQCLQLTEGDAPAPIRDEGIGAPPILIATGESWHPGVVGIVASRLVERFRRPVCVVAQVGGVGVGSGRSIPGADLGAAVIAAREAGLLLRGGGHPMAAGFTVEPARLGALGAFLAGRLAADVAAVSNAPVLRVDGTLSVGGGTAPLAGLVAQAGPFGAANPEPRFAVAAARVVHATVSHGGHVRCILGDAGGGKLPGIAFRSAAGPVGEALLRHDGAPVHVAGRLRRETYRGRTKLVLHIDDVAPTLRP